MGRENQDSKFLSTRDYYIIRLRINTTKYYLKKFHNYEQIGLIKQRDAVEKYLDFFWNFVNLITGRDSKYYYINYNSSVDCAKEELNDFDIHVKLLRTDYDYYFIPKTEENISIVRWMFENAKVDIKIVKKLGGYPVKNNGTWYREHFKNKQKWIDKFTEIL